MSKNVKSNNKNTKKSASKSKKSTRNIYKIESLEPRLMMDAEPLDSALEPNLDMEQFDSYVEQIGNLSDSIGEKAVESLGQFDKIDFTQFHLADKANAAVLNIFPCSLIRYLRFAKADGTNCHEAFAVPASKRSRDKQSYSGDTLVFLCGEGRFAKQTMERSDFVCVRNEPRSKHSNKKRFWLEPVIPAQGRDDNAG